MIEPVAQLAWAEVSGGDVPDEDSRVVDFDEGNLFTLDRFPGHDESEVGARLNLGLSYTRLAEGWELNGYVGRVLRFDDEFQFDEATGLDGEWSDWLVSGQLGVADNVLVTNRAVFDDEFDFARNELRLALEAGAAEFAASYLWLLAEPEIDRDDDVNEAIFSAGYDFNRHWFGGLETRWDIVAGRLSRTDVGVTYRNECIAVDLSVTHRYEGGDDTDPTLDFGVEVSLQGFGGGDSSRYARTCPG
jgi:LPS-assembly protein